MLVVVCFARLHLLKSQLVSELKRHTHTHTHARLLRALWHCIQTLAHQVGNLCLKGGDPPLAVPHTDDKGPLERCLKMNTPLGYAECDLLLAVIAVCTFHRPRLFGLSKRNRGFSQLLMEYSACARENEFDIEVSVKYPVAQRVFFAGPLESGGFLVLSLQNPGKPQNQAGCPRCPAPRRVAWSSCSAAASRWRGRAPWSSAGAEFWSRRRLSEARAGRRQASDTSQAGWGFSKLGTPILRNIHVSQRFWLFFCKQRLVQESLDSFGERVCLTKHNQATKQTIQPRKQAINRAAKF